MYLHLGQETVVKTDDIIGVFDLETSTLSKHTRNFLAQAEKNKSVVNVTKELPKTFVVMCPRGKNKQKVYISQISTTTLQKRNRKLGSGLQKIK